MNGRYDHLATEKKWQDFWYTNKTFAAHDFSDKPKYFLLIEFPYPSGNGLHVGHPRSYTALDIMARKKRLDGFNVLYPIGWDAFGLPTENFAIKNKVHPKKITADNVATFKRQLRSLGFAFDWDREINTTDENYYKWTQWIFLKFFEKGLAYKANIPINWCVSCKIGLANEEVKDGACERCGGTVEKRNKEQWMLAITQYAQPLIDDLDTVNYLEKIKKQQIYWIGRSEGASVDFTIAGSDHKITVFTTRPDTLFGATYMVLAPEHPLVDAITADSEKDAVRRYVDTAALKSDMERTELAKEKTGVFTGAYAVNPATQEKIPVWIADYVLISYGTGAIMAVPGHDQRDWEFAVRFKLPIKEVIKGGDITRNAHEDDGILVNSDFLNGKDVPSAIAAMIAFLQKKKIGTPKVNYKLRDWVFSRQRYWGEPIPIVHCEKCGAVALPESELPLVLPSIDQYEPTDTGESPLAAITEWVHTTCPVCNGPAKRETDTMPNWAGSSWYFLRYIDPHNDGSFAAADKLKYWMPVDLYNGGMEHTTLHLLYSRFWNKFLYDCGLVPTAEPYARRTSHGMILGKGGAKMSKSLGNVINPDQVVNQYGADVFRCYEMFIGPFDQTAAWDTKGIEGIQRFIHRVWRLIIDEDDKVSKKISDTPPAAAQMKILHQTIKVVTEHIDQMRFNTGLSQMMTFVNEIYKEHCVAKSVILDFLIILSPYAPHITEELWERLSQKPSVAQAEWPRYDPAWIVENTVTFVIQVNGKVRAKLILPADITEPQLKEKALTDESVQKWIAGKKIIKTIIVPRKLVNLVVLDK